MNSFFSKPWVWVLIVVVLIGGWLVTSYNGFATANLGVDNAWAQVENQFQRRFDLIPNLVESVKGLQQQEQAVFLGIAEARTKYSGATTIDEKAAAAGQVETALGRLLAVIENYPNLSSSAAVSQLMDELAGTENRIAVERQRYNDSVTTYNTMRARVPGSIVASLFGFGPRELFKADTGAEKAPEVKF